SVPAVCRSLSTLDARRERRRQTARAARRRRAADRETRSRARDASWSIPRTRSTRAARRAFAVLRRGGESVRQHRAPAVAHVLRRRSALGRSRYALAARSLA